MVVFESERGVESSPSSFAKERGRDIVHRHSFAGENQKENGRSRMSIMLTRLAHHLFGRHQLDATVLRPTLIGIIRGDEVGLAEAARGQPRSRDPMVFQVPGHRLGAALR